MPSPLFVALEAHIANLHDDLLTLGVDYDKLSRSDLTRAVGFRVLASAAVEEYVEDRCRQVAELGADRFLNNQPTRTGRALVVWYLARGPRGAFPLKDAEHIPQLDLVNGARTAYLQSVSRTHGISEKDLSGHIWPLGARDHDVDTVLFDILESWSTQRDRAVHVRLKRVREETTPDGEWKIVSDLLPLLGTLDEGLEEVLTSY